MNLILNRLKGDRVIWIVVVILSLFSLMAVYTSVSSLAFKSESKDSGDYLVRHLIILLSGFGLIYVAHSIKYTYYSRIAQLALFAAVPLLFITLKSGLNLNEASRWIGIPFINVTFQPSDFGKLALMMYLARLLSIKQNVIKDFNSAFIPVMLPILVVCGLILPANFSTAAILFVTSLVLLFVGRINMKYIFSLIGIGVLLLLILVLINQVAPEVLPRLETWIQRGLDFIYGVKGEQVQASEIAIANGGIFGMLPGNSIQRNFLSHSYSDFIYAIIVEEFGLIGGRSIVFLYLILLYRGVRIVIKSPGTFGAFLAMGVCFGMVFQAMINMAVAVGLFPVTGQTLPLISMGGTSLWFTCISVGILLSVSREVEETKEVDLHDGSLGTKAQRHKGTK